MRRFGFSSLHLAAGFGLAMMVIPTRARADLTLYDRNGWSVYTRGMVAAHYQLMVGDADPLPKSNGVLVGGLFLDGGARDARDNSLILSRVRSGFIGTQIGFGINRQISENVHVSSLLAVSLNDISSSRGSEPVKGVDFREAWAALETPYGALKFGRMFSIFGSASGEVVLLAYRYALGSPCFAELATIGCASVGAGPIYAGFDAQLRYITPRLDGLEFQLAVSDPVKASDFYVLTPFPRVDAQLSYENQFGPVKLRVIGQGLWEEIQGVDLTNTIKRAEVWGGMGSAILNWGGLSLGAGGWTGAGLGTRTVLEVGTNDTSSPLTFGGANKELRIFRGFYGNLAFNFQGSALAAGGGILYVRPVISAPGKDDDDMKSNSVLSQQAEAHLVFTQQIDTVILTAEYMHWNEQWHFLEKRDLNFGGVGANFTW